MKNKFLLILTLLQFSIVSAENQNESTVEKKQIFETELQNHKKEVSMMIRELKISIDEKNVELDKKFNDLSKKLSDDYGLMKWIAGLVGSLTLLFICGILWNAKKYVDSKLKEKIDKIISEQETNILDILEKNDLEKQILATKKILVLSSRNGDDIFIRKFFKAMNFSIDNVKYNKVEKYKKVKGSYDLIFANNEDEKLEHSIIDEYFNNSNSKVVLFYYNTTTKRYNNAKVQNRLSFANSPTQIYGNLINLVKYQTVLNEK